MSRAPVAVPPEPPQVIVDFDISLPAKARLNGPDPLESKVIVMNRDATQLPQRLLVSDKIKHSSLDQHGEVLADVEDDQLDQ